MRFPNITPAILLTAILLSTGCVTLYKPNMVNSPILAKKGDGNVTAALSFSGSGMANVQASGAVSDNIGIMANGMYHSERTSYQSDSSGNATSKLKIYSFEAGVGYFDKIGDGNWGFQAYGGGGMGASKDYIDYSNRTDPEASADFINIFIQPGLFIKKRNIEMGFDFRTNYVNVYNISGNLYNEFDWWNTDYNFTSDSTLDFVLVEPTFTLRGGGKNLKAHFQAGVTIPAINSDSYYAVNDLGSYFIPPVKLSVGLSYTFGKKE